MRCTASSRIVTAPAIPNPRCLTPDGMAAAHEYAHRTDKTVSIHVLETSTDGRELRFDPGFTELVARASRTLKEAC